MGFATARVVLVAVLLAGFSIEAQTVEQYQQEKSDPKSTEALLNQIYIKGLGQGIQIANAAMLIQTLKLVKGSLQQPEHLSIYCEPVDLIINTENLMSILDREIQRRLDLAATPTQTSDVMKSSIPVVLLQGLSKVFPCTSDSIKQQVASLRKSLAK